MMVRKQTQGMSRDMLRVHLVREQMDKQIEDWLIFHLSLFFKTGSNHKADRKYL